MSIHSQPVQDETAILHYKVEPI